MSRLGVHARATVTRQWLVRVVVGLMALGFVRFVAPTLGVTILSPSLWIDRFFALNHTMPSMGQGGASIIESSPLMSIDLGVSLLVMFLQFFVICCTIFALWSWYNQCVTRPVRPAAIDRGDL